MRTVRAQPWLICLHPPDSSESREAFHARRTKEKLERLHECMECAEMSANDPQSSSDPGASVAAKLSHHFVNRHPDPEVLRKRDSNHELQQREPMWYGPYLDEGERYKTPRTVENWDKACAAMGLDDLPDEDLDEREFYRSLVWELWILFDGANFFLERSEKKLCKG